MATGGALGRLYQDGEIIVRQGDAGDCLFVIREGRVEAVFEGGGNETVLRELGPGEIAGGMAIFERVARSATVCAKGQARLLIVDRKNLSRGNIRVVSRLA